MVFTSRKKDSTKETLHHLGATLENQSMQRPLNGML